MVGCLGWQRVLPEVHDLLLHGRTQQRRKMLARRAVSLAVMLNVRSHGYAGFVPGAGTCPVVDVSLGCQWHDELSLRQRHPWFQEETGADDSH